MTTIKELKSDKNKFKNDYSKFVEICNLLGHKYREVCHYDEAVQEHLDAILCCDKIKNQTVRYELEAISRRALGECYSEMGQHEEALFEHDLYLNLAQKLNDTIEIQRAHATIGRTYLLWALDNDTNTTNHSALRKANSSFQEALQLCENLMSSGKLKTREYAEMKSRILLNLGLVHENLLDYEKCKSLLFDSIELTKKNFLLDELFRCQISLGAIYEKIDSLDNALGSYEGALETANLFKSKMKQLDAFLCLGLIWMKLENVERSRKYFKKAYKLNIRVNEDKEKVFRLLKIASIIRDDLQKLQKYSSELNNREQNLDEIITLCDRLGDHFVEMKCYSAAVKYYKKELFHATEADKPDSLLAKIYISIGETYFDDHKYGEAITYFKHECNLNIANKCEQCASLNRIASIQEIMYERTDELETEERIKLKNETIHTYKSALNLFDLDTLVDNLGSIDSSNVKDSVYYKELKSYNQTATNYLDFLKKSNIHLDQQEELLDNLSRLRVVNCMTEENEKEIEISDEESHNGDSDIYESYSLDLLSSDSDQSLCENDEEIPENFRARPKRNSKSSKVTNRLNQFGETPLHTACIAGNIGQVERLIEQKVNINAKDYCGWTPLHEACNHGYPEIVQCLLNNGANIEACDEKSDNITPLHDSCQCGHLSIARLLLKYGANVLALNTQKETPVECLMNWRKRCELSKAEIEDCLLLENEMMNLMKEKGFDLNNLLNGKKNSSNTSGQLKPYKRCNLVNDEIYSTETVCDRLWVDDSQSDSDIDNPKVARAQYCNAIESLRRNRWKSKNQFDQRSHSALLAEDELVPRDDWLIDDLSINSKTRKRTKLDYANHSSYSKKLKATQNDSLLDNSSCDSLSESDNSAHVQPIDLYCNIEEFPNDSIQSDSIEDSGDDICIVEMKNNEHYCAQANKSPKPNGFGTDTVESGTHDEAIKQSTQIITVNFDDIDKSSFGVLIQDPAANCKWLVEELTKRYFAKYGIKPVISLETDDNAALCETDLVIDIVNTKDSIRAKIVSWVVDRADNRYVELCQVNDELVDEDLKDCLKLSSISGLLRLHNVYIPSCKQIMMIFQSLFRQEIKEMDISFSNLLMDADTYKAFQSTLSYMSTLEVLHLSGVGFPVKRLVNLLNISPVLKVLDLSFNSLDDNQAYTVTQIINMYPKLEHLNLTACDLSSTFVKNKLLINSIESSKLKRLDLDYNDIDDTLVDKFKTLNVNRYFLKDL